MKLRVQTLPLEIRCVVVSHRWYTVPVTGEQSTAFFFLQMSVESKYEVQGIKTSKNTNWGECAIPKMETTAGDESVQTTTVQSAPSIPYSAELCEIQEKASSCCTTVMFKLPFVSDSTTILHAHANYEK